MKVDKHQNKLQNNQNTITKTVRDAGEVMGELAGLAAELGRAEGTLYLCKLLRKYKVGTNDIESEAAKMWKENCQRAVGVKDKERMVGKRNVRVVMEKVETLRRTAVINVKEGRLRFEEEVKRVFREKGFSLGSRGAKNLKLKLEGERVRALEEDKKMKEAKVAHFEEEIWGNGESEWRGQT